MRSMILIIALCLVAGCSSSQRVQRYDSITMGPTNIVLVSNQIVTSQDIWIGVRLGGRPSDVTFRMAGRIDWSFVQRDDGIELTDLSITWYPRGIVDNDPVTHIEVTESGKAWHFHHTNGYGHVKHLTIHTWLDTDHVLHVEPRIQQFSSYKDKVGPYEMEPVLVDLSRPPPQDVILFSGVVFFEQDAAIRAQNERFHDWLNDYPTASEVRR